MGWGAMGRWRSAAARSTRVRTLCQTHRLTPKPLSADIIAVLAYFTWSRCFLLTGGLLICAGNAFQAASVDWAPWDHGGEPAVGKRHDGRRAGAHVRLPFWFALVESRR